MSLREAYFKEPTTCEVSTSSSMVNRDSEMEATDSFSRVSMISTTWHRFLEIISGTAGFSGVLVVKAADFAGVFLSAKTLMSSSTLSWIAVSSILAHTVFPTVSGFTGSQKIPFIGT